MAVEFQLADSAADGAAFLALFDEATDEGEHARRVMARGTHDLFVARHGERVVGGVLCSEVTARPGTGGVENLVVAPDYTGRGIVRRLMEMAEVHYSARGCSGMQVSVRADNAPARALYDALGYHAVERRVRMWKELAPGPAGTEAETNVRVVQRWTDEVWNAGELHVAPELVADGCIRHDPGKRPQAISLAENLGRIALLKQRIPNLRFRNDDLVADGDRVVARFTMTGTDPESREPFAFSGIEIFRLAAGKIVETWSSETAAGPWQDSLAR